MKSTILIAIVLCLFAQGCFSALPQTELDALKTISDAYTLKIDISKDVCKESSDILKCSTDKDGAQHVVYMSLPSNVGAPLDILADFSALTMLADLRISTGYIIQPALWTSTLSKLPLVNLYCFDRCMDSVPAEFGSLIPASLNVLHLRGLTFELPSSIFDASITDLSLPGMDTNVKLPELLKPNENITRLQLSNLKSGYPKSYVNFTVLDELIVEIFDHALEFDTFDQFTLSTLKFVALTTPAPPAAPAVTAFPLSVLKIKTLTTLVIQGDLFKSSTKQLDFSATALKSITINRAPALFKTLESPSFILPESIDKINLDNNDIAGPIPVDIFKFRMVSLRNNALTGPLPTTGNFTAIQNLNLVNNSLTGTVPAGICFTKATNLANNKFSGDAPACMICSPNTVKSFIAGNNFDNVDDTLKGCPTFAIEGDYSAAINSPASGSDVIITGTDLGWSVIPDDKTFKVTVLIPNKMIKLSIPAGSDKILTNKVTLAFVDNQITKDFTFTYVAPTYELIMVLNSDVGIFGKNFGTNKDAVAVTINQIPVPAASVIDTEIVFGYLTDFKKIVGEISDTTVNISITVSGQTVVATDLFLISPPLFTTYSQVNRTGGAFTMTGLHFGDKSSYLNITINENATMSHCPVTSSNNTQVVCTIAPGKGEFFVEMSVTKNYHATGFTQYFMQCPGTTPCNGNGLCFVNGTCECPPGTEGPACQPSSASMTTMSVMIIAALIALSMLF
eukprot:gene3842-4435_t